MPSFADLPDLLLALPAPPPSPPDGLPFGNRKDPVEELIYIVLTLMTRAQGPIARSMQGLLDATNGDLTRVHEVPEDDLDRILRPLGFVSRRTRQLVSIGRMLEDDFGGDLESLRHEEPEQAIGTLVRFPGVGVKTAKCVLMYSLDVEVLPVDVHVLRVSKRLGLVPMGQSWAETDRSLEAGVPGPLKFDTHVRFVHHGQQICRTRAPRCVDCPVAPACPVAFRPSQVRADYVDP